MSIFLYSLAYFLRTWLIVYVLIGLAWFVQSHRLFYKFRDRHPEVARRDIPYAFDWVRDPEKYRYFFRESSILLLQADPQLWRLREQVRLLAKAIFMVFPLLFLAAISLIVILKLFQ